LTEIPGDRLGPARRQDWLTFVAAGGIAVLLGSVLADLLRFGPVDDGFISLRYARNWAGGMGLVFNPGERVEGYTNFLLVLLEAAAIRLGIDPLTAMKGVGWAALGALAGTIAFWAGRLLYPTRPVLAALAGLLVTLNPAVLGWTLSGMETPIYALLLFLLATSVLGAGGGANPLLVAGLLALAAMTRPEGVVLLPALLFLHVAGGGTRRGAGRLAVSFAIAYGVYFLLRALHFESLFPNTFYAKLDYGNQHLALRGLRYVGSFAIAAPLLALSAAAPIFLRGRLAWVRGFLLLAGIHILTVVYEGGDHFALFRFMVPILPLLSLLALHFWSRLARANRLPPVAREAIGAIGPAVLLASCFTLAGVEYKEYQVSHLERFRREASYAQSWSTMGKHLRDRAPEGASLSTAAIGAIGYYSDLRVIDPHGLVNREIGRREKTLGLGYPGHEKFDVDYILSERPSYLLLLNLPLPAAVPEETAARMVWGEFNKAIVRDPRLRSDYRYEQVRLGGPCWGIHVRKDLPPLGDRAR